MTRVMVLDTLLPDLAGYSGPIYGTRVESLGRPVVLLASTLPSPGLLAFASTDVGSFLPSLVLEGGHWHYTESDHSVPVEILPWATDYAKRTAGLVDPSIRKRRVAILGVSSLGLSLALYLGRLVESLILVDGEPVAIENLVRVAFGSEHLGLPKVQAATELAVRANPRLKVTAIAKSLNEALRDEPRLLDDADLIVNAASNAVGFRLASMYRRTPQLFPGLHARAASGEVFVSLGRPDESCFSCFRRLVPTPPAARRSWNYDADDGELQAEPGLGSDIGHLVAITASLAIAILSGRGSELVPEDRRLLLVSHRHGALLDTAFSTCWARVPRNPECPNHAEPTELAPSEVAALLATIPEVGQ